MKVVIAPDSFKESLTSLEVASEIEAGMRRVWPNATYVKVPMADGGEGTVEALVAATGGSIVAREVLGPLGAPVKASYGLLGGGKTAVIEMAAASGLPLVERGKRDPLRASTYGTGQLVADALTRGVEEIIMGVGGSATNDGGAGLAQALGVLFLDEAGAVIADPLGGGRLNEIAAIKMSGLNPAVKRTRFTIACDVTNPLTGPEGASKVYGPQKGATPEMVAVLDRNLAHFAKLIRRDLGLDINPVEGAGAGGGLGAGLIAFTNAVMKRGVGVVVEATQLERHMAGADLAITGEGRVDFQTAFGKTPSGVASAARRHGVPVVAIGGGLADDAGGVFEHGIEGLMAATSNVMTLEVALSKARQYLQDAGERVARLVSIGQRIGRKGGDAQVDPDEFGSGLVPPSNRPVRRSDPPKKRGGATEAAIASAMRRTRRPT